MDDYSGTYVQLNPIKSDPQLAGKFVNKTEFCSTADFPTDPTIKSSSNPKLNMGSSTDVYENVHFDKAHEKPSARQNKQTNNYSQVVSELKKKLPKPAPKPKDVSKKHSDTFNMFRKKSAVGFDTDITDGLRRNEICSTHQILDDRPESDCTEMYKRESQISFTRNGNENRDSDIYSRNSKASDIYEYHNEKYDVSDVYENVEHNVPDDVKAKKWNIGMGDYVTMDSKKTKRRKSASDLLNNDSKLSNMSTYATMCIIKRTECLSNRNLRSYKPNTESCHIKGDEGCIYGRMDPKYIYSINPDCVTGNAPPFVRTKEKTDPLPCFCPKNAWGTQRVAEKELFFSCEDIYVNVCSLNECSGGTIGADNADDPIFRDIVDSTRVDDDTVSYVIEKFENDAEDSDTDSRSSASLIRKKLQQLKRLVTDWT